jgi:hypothetical protein
MSGGLVGNADQTATELDVIAEAPGLDAFSSGWHRT